MTKAKAQSLGGKLFSLPTTALCAVIWFAGQGTNKTKYRAIMETPVSNDGLQVAMLARGCSWRQIGGVYPFTPTNPSHSRD